MFAVEKKYEIELKLKKEMSNIQELKAAADRSSKLAGEVCNVLGACEKRLQQLESAVFPLYVDTAKLQQVYYNLENTVKSLDHVINYYMVAQELAELIQAGPHMSNTETLNTYLKALEKLTDAQNYFNKNNPQSVELENINQLYNTGVGKLENAFEDLLSRNTRPLSPTTLMDMIALEEDSSVDSVSVTASGSSSTSSGLESMRAAAGWLITAGRPPSAALLTIRAPAAKSSLLAFKDYLKTRSMGASPLMRHKNLLIRSDSTKKTSKIHKVLEKRATKIMWKASQTLEQSTGFSIGHRRPAIEPQSEPGEPSDEYWADMLGDMATCVCRLAKAEQRYLLGLVPLPMLPGLLTDVMKECFTILNDDVERAWTRWRRTGPRGAAVALGWGLLTRLMRLRPDVERTLATVPPPLYLHTVTVTQRHCLRSLEDWIESLRTDNSRAPEDGTVHELAASGLALLQSVADHVHTLGPALASEPAYSRAAAAAPATDPHDRDALMLSIYMRKVLAQLNVTLRTKSEEYPDALKAIFMLNNTLYLFNGLQRSGLIVVLMLSEPDCKTSYENMIEDYKNNYLQSWNKLLAHTVLEETPPAKLRDRDRQMLKDKFASFNREFEECTKVQRKYSVPEAVLRETLKRDNKEVILPPYTKFYDTYSVLPFSKNPEKYVKYSPVQIASQLDGYFDEAA